MEVMMNAAVTLYWIPLGAGGHFVRRNGRIFEAVVARREHREPQDLYHAALEVELEGDRFSIEMGPAWNVRASDRGVVQTGPVGLRWLGRSVFFRYEVRCWRGGTIPDLAEAVDAHQVSADPTQARQVLDLAPLVPALTWGRDELHAGEMWNSNSLTAWLLARSGHQMAGIHPPVQGRAPGWQAGELLAATDSGRPAPARACLASGVPARRRRIRGTAGWHPAPRGRTHGPLQDTDAFGEFVRSRILLL
jgi:hypothetical protein